MARKAKPQTIYLHVGLHKTGTTAIQSAFEGYRGDGVRYAELGYRNHSIPFYTAYSGRHQSYHIWEAAGLTPAQADGKKAEFAHLIDSYFDANSGDDIIVSGEDISMIPPPGISGMFGALARSDRKVIVIVYVRDPVSLAASRLQEVIKADTYRGTPPSSGYRQRIEKFLKIAGKDNLVIRNYARSELKDRDIVSDFAAIVGCAAPKAPENTNETLSVEAVRIIHLLNGFVSAFGEGRQMREARWVFVERIRALFPGPFHVPAHLLASSIDAGDVAWLKSVSGIDYGDAITPAPADDGWRSLDQFLSTPREATLQVLRDEFIPGRKVPAPGADPALVVARCFLAFLETRRGRG